MADETKIKAAPLQYDSAALAKPRKQAPPPGRAGGGGGGRSPEDVLTAAQVLLDNRGEWYIVAERVANPGRFYDAFRGQGAQVRVARRAGETTKLPDAAGVTKDVPLYDVYAMIPAGPIKPWKKGKGAGKTESGETRPPVQSAPTTRPTVVPSGRR